MGTVLFHTARGIARIDVGQYSLYQADLAGYIKDFSQVLY